MSFPLSFIPRRDSPSRGRPSTVVLATRPHSREIMHRFAALPAVSSATPPPFGSSSGVLRMDLATPPSPVRSQRHSFGICPATCALLEEDGPARPGTNPSATTAVTTGKTKDPDESLPLSPNVATASAAAAGDSPKAQHQVAVLLTSSPTAQQHKLQRLRTEGSAIPRSVTPKSNGPPPRPATRPPPSPSYAGKHSRSSGVLASPLTPVSTLGEGTASSASDACGRLSMPAVEVAAGIERRLANELRLLHKAKGGAPTPEEQLAVYREAAGSAAACFPSHNRLLRRIFDQYDLYVKTAAASLVDERQKLAQQVVAMADLQAQVSDLRAQIQQRDDAERDRLRAAEEKMRRRARDPELLVEAIEDLEQRLAKERRERANAEEQLHRSAELSTEFQRALTAVQANYQELLDKQERRAVDGELALQQAGRERAAEQALAVKKRGELRDRLSAAEISKKTVENRVALLLERLRFAESRAAMGQAMCAELHNTVAALESRLERLGKPAGVLANERDVTMTPRPSRHEICAAVPALGSALQYRTTHALVNGLVEAAGLAQERAKAMGRAEAEMERESIAAIAKARRAILDDVREVTTAELAVQTDAAEIWEHVAASSVKGGRFNVDLLNE